MRRMKEKWHFLVLMFMLLRCLTIQAADDLITKQITIKLDKAGSLPDKISDDEKYKITNLKIVGEINGTDWILIRDMAGRDRVGNATKGMLSFLDLSETKIVKGGGCYYYYSHHIGDCYTENDKIGDNAFAYCYSLRRLIFPSNVTSIGSCAFRGCGGLTSLEIPFGVTSIAYGAFMGCGGLANLEIPSSVVSIGEDAFAGCSRLTNLVIPLKVVSINDGTFSGCGSLKSFTIPSEVMAIGAYAFSGCDKLMSLTIPSKVASIGICAFYNCIGLVSISVNWKTPLKIDSNIFEKLDKKTCVLYVPQGTLQDYRLADVWGDFGNIVEYDVTGIDNVKTSTAAKEVSRYSVNGQRLSAPTKGLNSVKYSDGSVKKVAVQ